MSILKADGPLPSHARPSLIKHLLIHPLYPPARCGRKAAPRGPLCGPGHQLRPWRGITALPSTTRLQRLNLSSAYRSLLHGISLPDLQGKRWRCMGVADLACGQGDANCRRRWSLGLARIARCCSIGRARGNQVPIALPSGLFRVNLELEPREMTGWFFYHRSRNYYHSLQ